MEEICDLMGKVNIIPIIIVLYYIAGVHSVLGMPLRPHSSMSSGGSNGDWAAHPHRPMSQAHSAGDIYQNTRHGARSRLSSVDSSKFISRLSCLPLLSISILIILFHVMAEEI